MKYLVPLVLVSLLLSSGCMSFRYEEELTRKRSVDYDNPFVEIAKVVVGKPEPRGPIKKESSVTRDNMAHFYQGGR